MMQYQTEISQLLLEGLPQNFVQTFMISRGWMAPILIIHCFFLLHHHLSPCGFDWNVFVIIKWIAMIFGTDVHIPLRINCPPLDGLPSRATARSRIQQFSVFGNQRSYQAAVALRGKNNPIKMCGFQLDWNSVTGSLIGYLSPSIAWRLKSKQATVYPQLDNYIHGPE